MGKRRLASLAFLLLAFTQPALARTHAAGDDVQRYIGLNVDMASGSIDFATHPPSVLVLDLPTSGNWEIRSVTLGEDNLTTDVPAYVRIACWFYDTDGQHPFASFRMLSGSDQGSLPFAPPEQQPTWLGEALQGQVWCGGGAPGATITGGMMWFRFDYRSV